MARLWAVQVSIRNSHAWLVKNRVVTVEGSSPAVAAYRATREVRLPRGTRVQEVIVHLHPMARAVVRHRDGDPHNHEVANLAVEVQP